MASGILCLHYRADFFFLKKLEADEVIKKLIRFKSTQNPIHLSLGPSISTSQPYTQVMYSQFFILAPLLWFFALSVLIYIPGYS